MGKKGKNTQPLQNDLVPESVGEFDADALLAQMEAAQTEKGGSDGLTEDEPLDAALAEAAEMLDQATLQLADTDATTVDADELVAAMAELTDDADAGSAPPANAMKNNPSAEIVTGGDFVETVSDVPEEVESAAESLNSAVERVTDTVKAIDDALDGVPGRTAAGSGSDANTLHERITQVKDSLKSDLDRATALLNEVDSLVQLAAKDRLKAEEYKKAAEEAQAASKIVAAIQQEVDATRAAWDAARKKLETAQRDWQKKRQAAEDASM